MIASTLKVAIVGKSPHSRDAAPYSDQSWEIWWTGWEANQVPRVTRVFELHDLDDGRQRWPAEYVKWLAENNGPSLWINAPHADFPNASIYPKDEILAEFGSYFSCSVSWEIALAVHLGATDIALYGVDMSVANNGTSLENEYGYQRPSCEFHLGFARGRGVNVYVHPASALLKCDHLYGYDLAACQRLRRLQQRKEHFAKEREKHRVDEIMAAVKKSYFDGVLEAYAEVAQWT